MKEILTAIGSTYAITSKNGCTVTHPNGDPIIEVPAGQQTLFIAQSSSILVSDEEARVTACGGSATLNFTSAAPSILSEGGSTGGLTANERALLNGAAQRGGDNTFTAANTFTGSVDMSTASVTPPSGWNVGELTREAVQAVVPMAWTMGEKASVATLGYQLAIGAGASSTQAYGTVVGASAKSAGMLGCAFGRDATVNGTYGIAVGGYAVSKESTAITLGSKFTETTDSGNVTHTCTTEGTGSITIGAGANTLNNGDTESSNSVTVGCKASNSGADSVVIGAQAKGTQPFCAIVGAGATVDGNNNAVLGYKATAGSSSVAVGMQSNACVDSVAIGRNSKVTNYHGVAVGHTAYAVEKSIAIGFGAKSADIGATVIRSTAKDGTYTQLYFSGANTPLANTYHGGAPMLGYVTKDSAGNIVAAGTRSLIDLLTDNSTFAPASLDENGEWVMPKVFHPSDLDLPVEEPSVPEEYQPLPVWPIVEPEIEEEI